MALFARISVEQEQNIDPAVRDQIAQLVADVELKGNYQLAHEIAMDVLSIDPELAFKLIDRAGGGEAVEKDFSYAALTLMARENSRTRGGGANVADESVDRIADKEVQQFVKAVSLGMSGQTAAEIVERTKNTGTKERLLILSSWLDENQKAEGADLIVENALDAMIADQSFTPTIADFRRVALPLRYMKDSARAKYLIKRLDQQKNLALGKSASEDFVRLELLLAEAERQFDLDGSENRIVDLWSYVNDIQEEATRCDCLAWFVARSDAVDPNAEIERRIGIFSEAHRTFEALIARVLANTGGHQHVVESAVRAFARTRPAAALQLIEKVNTRDRRDGAYNKAALAAARYSNEVSVAGTIRQMLEKIESRDTRDETVKQVVQTLLDRGARFIVQLDSTEIRAIADLSTQIRDPIDRGSSVLKAYQIVDKSQSPPDDLLRSLLLVFDRAIDLTCVGWAKLELSFLAAVNLARSRPELATQYLKRGEGFKRSLAITSQVGRHSVAVCGDLAARCFAGLAASRKHNQDDLQALHSVLMLPEDLTYTCRIWSEIAIWAYMSGNVDLSRTITNEYLKPTFGNIPDDEGSGKHNSYVQIVPALYMTNPIAVLGSLRGMPRETREAAANVIFDVLVQRVPPSDPYQASLISAFRLQPDVIQELLALTELFETDHLIYWAVALISHSIEMPDAPKLTGEQRGDVIVRLGTLIASKLPDKANIKHEGYVIACEACLFTLQSKGMPEWRALIRRAESIPNTSDAAFCLTVIANALPRKLGELIEECISRIREFIERIPSDLDRCDRYYTIGDMLQDTHRSTAKEFMLRAMEESLATRDAAKAGERQRRIINALHRLDDRLARQFAERMDSDPARAAARNKIAVELNEIETERQLDNFELTDRRANKVKSALPKACWQRLGSLNAGRQAPISREGIFSGAVWASEFALPEAFPIMALVIRSAVQRYRDSKDVDRVVRPGFEVLMQAAQHAHMLAKRYSALRMDVNERGAWNRAKYLLGSSSRERVGQIIEAWLRRNQDAQWVRIADPYFLPDDLWLVKLIRECLGNSSISVLTSRKACSGLPQPWDDEFARGWRAVSDMSSAGIEIIIAGYVDSGLSPIHDRWITTATSGVRLGSSIGGIGVSRESEVSLLTAEEALQINVDADPYFRKDRHANDGRPIRYLSYSM